MYLDWTHLDDHLISRSLTLIALQSPFAVEGNVVTGSDDQDVDILEGHCSAHRRARLVRPSASHIGGCNFITHLWGSLLWGKPVYTETPVVITNIC